ncbi:hypothetical protein BAU10_06240 [Vibrio alginolyticus]|nr:hypothetical protein BAU10_06240 [Vibrio alginolyticus]
MEKTKMCIYCQPTVRVKAYVHIVGKIPTPSIKNKRIGKMSIQGEMYSASIAVDTKNHLIVNQALSAKNWKWLL